MPAPVTLDGRSLSIEDVIAVARDGANVAIAPRALDAVRAMMLLRANVLLRGTSGVRPALPELIVAMLNQRVHPRVPSQGSVGASGDLAPLAHLALAMIGEGTDGGAVQAGGLQPIALEAKEGLAFLNGAQAPTRGGGP